MEKVLVSSCLLGQPVRYDGVSKGLRHPGITQLMLQDRVISFCPEVSGGLPTPREPAEILETKVMTKSGEDVSKEFALGAQLALRQCQQHGIRYALLKESSPSCGRNNIYDGTHTSVKIPGMGWTARLLEENDIHVFSEDEISALMAALRE